MIPVLVLTLALPLAAQAQTVKEAARVNVALATQLCFDIMLNRIPPRMAFETAGFTYRAVDRGTNDFGVVLGLDHYFEAPADTAKAEVPDPDQMTGLCSVYTTFLDQNTLDAIINGVVANQPPMRRTERRREGSWVLRQGDSLPLIVTTRTITNNHRYEPPGTVTVSMSFPG